jgi:hypothetical protein
MAQWLGQFTGNTHATRIAELGAHLRHAIAAYRSSGDDATRRKRAKSIRNLAKRLAAARIRNIKAKLVSAELDEAQGKGIVDVGLLREELAHLEATGPEGILVELGVLTELVRV